MKKELKRELLIYPALGFVLRIMGLGYGPILGVCFIVALIEFEIYGWPKMPSKINHF